MVASARMARELRTCGVGDNVSGHPVVTDPTGAAGPDLDVDGHCCQLDGR